MTQMFEIPLPVSANRMWRKSRGRTHLATEYKQFILALGWYCKMQQVDTQPGPCRLTLLVRGGKGWRISNDLDNRLKPTLDALVRNRILEDDDVRNVPQQELIYIERPSRIAEVRCFVRLGELDPSWDWFVLPPSPTAGGRTT